MNFLNKMLLEVDLRFLQPIVNVLNVILVPFIALVSTAGTIYAIILGVNMAKSDTADKREIAKKRITGVIATMIILIALILLLKFVLGNLDTWING